MTLSTTPAVLADGTVLRPGSGRTLFALDANGRLLWKEQLSGFVLSPADRGDGRVYVADMAGTVGAIDVAGSHRVAWTTSLGTISYGSPAIAPDGSVITTVDDEVVAVTDQGDTGIVRWRWRAPATLEVSAAVAPDGTLYIGSATGDPLRPGQRNETRPAHDEDRHIAACPWILAELRRQPRSRLSRYNVCCGAGIGGL